MSPGVTTTWVPRRRPKDGRGNGKVNAPVSALEQMSSFTYLNEISAPISIHHGGLDEVVPVQWSRDLCVTLDGMGKDVRCKEYPDQPHTFKDAGDTDFINDMIAFFDVVIKVWRFSLQNIISFSFWRNAPSVLNNQNNFFHSITTRITFFIQSLSNSIFLHTFPFFIQSL